MTLDTTEKSKVSLDELNALVAQLTDLGVSVRDMMTVLESEDPVTSLATMLNHEPRYPHGWSTPTLHAYGFVKELDNWPAKMELDTLNVTYKVCADCGTHVWVTVDDIKLHLSMRASEFVQVTPGLQLKATRRGLMVRQSKPLQDGKYCRFACD